MLCVYNNAFRFVEKKGCVGVREKIHPMFKPKILHPLERDINFIIIDNRNITISELCHQLHCPDIPPEITVVHREWLEQCLSQKTLLDVEKYVIDVSATPTTAMKTNNDSKIAHDDNNCEKKEGATTSSFEASTGSQKRKRDVDYSCDIVDDQVNSKLLKGAIFTYLDSSSLLHNEFNTILSDTGKPSLLYHFAPLSKPTFNQLIAFDMDKTLITTKSEATFSKSVDDWKFLYPNVPSVLRQKYEEGAHLAIISNQNGIAKGHTTLAELTQKLKAITTAIGK
jgi:hypothetical protein